MSRLKETITDWIEEGADIIAPFIIVLVLGLVIKLYSYVV